MDLLEEYRLELTTYDANDLPGQIARTGMLLAEARFELDALSVELVAWRATLYEHYAAKNAKAGQWKINAAVEAKPEWLAWQVKINEAKQEIAELEATLEGLRLRAALELRTEPMRSDAGPLPHNDYDKRPRSARTKVKSADKAKKP